MKIEQDLSKLYYSIGEVSELLGVSNSLIRYWEGEFSSLKPRKNNKGDRRFTVPDIHQLALIYTLVKERGFTLDGAKTELKRLKKINKKKTEVIDKLKRVNKQLDEISDAL